MDVLRHYVEDNGFVDLRFTESIGRSQQQYMLHGSPVINDCMYRNMYSFTRILVIDFDEILMPLQATNLHDLIADLDRSFTARKSQPPPVHYVFYNNYFFLDLPPDINESPYVTFMRFTKRVAVSEYGYSVKSIIDPQACLQMHNHYCWMVTPGYTQRGFIEVVAPHIAVNQHYKNCHLNKTECARATSQFFEDSTVARFKLELKQKTREKVNTILKQNI